MVETDDMNIGRGDPEDTKSYKEKNSTAVSVGGTKEVLATTTNSSFTKAITLAKRVVLLGERNSGTRWMTSEIQKCFPRIRSTPRLVRWKHWFQEDDGKIHNPVLVIAQFRNVYEWTEAMRNVPHHAPEHSYLDWKEFVTKTWGMKRPKRDLALENKEGRICYEKFRYDQLISCVEGSRDDDEVKDAVAKGNKKILAFSGHKPIYELRQDGSGEPFANILEMRAAKIRNFLETKEYNWVVDSIPVQYEQLLSEGTDFLLKVIEEKTGLKRECEAIPPQTRKKRKLKKELIEYLTKNVDWDAEKLVGYSKWDQTSSNVATDEEEEQFQEEEEEESADEDSATTKAIGV